MRLPNYDDLSEEQLGVYEHPLDEPLFAVGPPGSGKTVLAIQRAQMVSYHLEYQGTPQDVPVITYNRMLRRLLELLVEEDEHIAPTTYHSFVSSHYKESTGASAPQLQRYVFQWDVMLRTLSQRGLSGDIAHLVVDEGQDLPKGFFQYAARNAQLLSIFADDDQALDEQGSTLEDITSATGLGDPILLSKNHRNAREVAKLAEHFHSGRLPAAEVQRTKIGELPRLLQRSLSDTSKLIANWFRTRGGTVGVIVDRQNTANKLCWRIKSLLPDTEVHAYAGDKQNENEIDVLEEGVTILNKRSVKGQEFDTVFILELDQFLPCKTDADKRAMYMMCTRARDRLFLVHSDDLSSEAEKALPKREKLERG